MRAISFSETPADFIRAGAPSSDRFGRKSRREARRRDRARCRPAVREARLGSHRAALRSRRRSPLALQGRVSEARFSDRRGRDGPRKQRARCGSAVPKRIDSQPAGSERVGHPAVPGRIERPTASLAAEHLRLAAIAAGLERPAAPQASSLRCVRLAHAASSHASTRSRSAGLRR
jgi:hypothetical protein